MQAHLRKSFFIGAMALLVIAVAGSVLIAVTFSRNGGSTGASPVTQGE
ncbi:hypothetical protein [Ancylobacter defluvii]|uniref:Uncharacterized protein n=1 Tax=Ancylobacter defluvii TaxID=1282440 RepID=A0A9W6K0R8_9HYPH|nr:hypothetical protein [Ancylobacter defluvii]MBS7587111.1 hypothetical protein [Ancylobacter defluvii]GLK85414.1 hypothetical protein GCM10017653_34840 [Ancylobacter defluvii]